MTFAFLALGSLGFDKGLFSPPQPSLIQMESHAAGPPTRQCPRRLCRRRPHTSTPEASGPSPVAPSPRGRVKSRARGSLPADHRDSSLFSMGRSLLLSLLRPGSLSVHHRCQAATRQCDTLGAGSSRTLRVTGPSPPILARFYYPAAEAQVPVVTAEQIRPVRAPDTHGRPSPPTLTRPERPGLRTRARCGVEGRRT